MKPLPPARYRIEERGRRLVVIDQWAGNVEVTAAMPARADVVAPSQSASVTPGSLSASAATQRLAAGSAVRNTAASASSSVGSGKQPYGMARTFLRLQLNSVGAAQLTTTRLYDMKAPRTIWLTAPQMQSLNGMLVFGVIALAVAALVAFVTTPLLLIVPIFFLFNAAKGIRSKLTEKIDRLDPR